MESDIYVSNQSKGPKARAPTSQLCLSHILPEMGRDQVLVKPIIVLLFRKAELCHPISKFESQLPASLTVWP